MTRELYILAIITAFTLNVKAQILAQDTVRQRDWPVGVPMDDETIEWRQDVYRELDLTKPYNAGLYSGSNQEDGTTGLFAKVFELAVARKIDLYKYEIDGNEQLTKRNQTDIKNILDDFHINYTSEGNVISIDKNDVPYAEVTTFYLKEAIYYDAINSSFSTRVIALCPVIVMEDEFSDEPVRYPLFWVKYNQIEKYLYDIYTIPDYRNLAGKMPIAEYFALNLYEGDIYKVFNEQGNLLSQKFENNTALAKEKQRIMENMQRVKNTTYNIYYSEKKEVPEEENKIPSVKEKTKYKWIFPWQKKKMKKAIEESNPVTDNLTENTDSSSEEGKAEEIKTDNNSEETSEDNHQ